MIWTVRRDDGSHVEMMSGQMMALQHCHFGSARSSYTGLGKKEASHLYKKRVRCWRERWSMKKNKVKKTEVNLPSVLNWPQIFM